MCAHGSCCGGRCSFELLLCCPPPKNPGGVPSLSWQVPTLAKCCSALAAPHLSNPPPPLPTQPPHMNHAPPHTTSSPKPFISHTHLTDTHSTPRSTTTLVARISPRRTSHLTSRREQSHPALLQQMSSPPRPPSARESCFHALDPKHESNPQNVERTGTNWGLPVSKNQSACMVFGKSTAGAVSAALSHLHADQH